MLKGKKMSIQTSLFIITLCILTLWVSNYLLQVAAKRGWKISGTLQTAEKVTDIADIILKAFAPLFPATLTSITEKIIGYAKTSVAAAEQLYKTGNLQGDERKQYATRFIIDALKQEKCEVTPELQKLIETAVEASVSFMKNPIINNKI
jgi:hypothetical protein